MGCLLVAFVVACSVAPGESRRGGSGASDPAMTGMAPGRARTGRTAAGRDAWVIAEIEANNAALSPEDRTSKYCAMAAALVPFYRGTNHLFWSDFAGDARLHVFGDAKTRIWLQGDLHSESYGAFEDDDGDVIYDLDDFDEAVIADYQWDVWRMAISLALVAEENGGFSSGEIEDLVDAFTESYLDTLAGYRGNDDEGATSFTRNNTYGLLDDFLEKVEESSSRDELLDAWTLIQGGRRIFDLALEDLDPVTIDIAAAVTAAMPAYTATTGGNLRTIPGYFAVKDIARRRNAGIGSLGVPRYYVLIEGPSASAGDDRILDVKRQGTPTAYSRLDSAERALTDAAAATPAERTITGHRALIRDADDHLGWMRLPDGTYSARERSPHKKTFPIEDLDTMDRFRHLAEQWGAVLATAHARADEDYRADLIGYSFDKEVDERTDGAHSDFRALVRDVVGSYAPQVQLDYRAFVDHVSGQGLCAP
jgi:uncharacterized protein (DUF2252 family)